MDFNESTFTYGEIWQRATAYSRGLRATGVGPVGDTVVTMLDNNLLMDSRLWFAVQLAGGELGANLDGAKGRISVSCCGGFQKQK